MKEIVKKLTVDNVEYTLAFNLNVMQEIQEKYGTFAAWGTAVEPPDGEPNVNAILYGLTAMMNEGIEMDNEENGTNRPLLNQKQVGRIVTKVGLDNALSKLKEAVTDSTDNGEKNA